MVATPLRQAASVLLESAIRIAPPEAREWGEAMRGELDYVEGSWAAASWALGGASVMAKHALMSLLVPGRTGSEPGDELFAKHVSLHEVMLAVGAGCILAALLFFASPPFRQAFQVALRPWTHPIEIATWDFQPRFEALAIRAKARRDPEGIAFCAVRLRNSLQSARLAEEAVQIDSNFIWVYALVAMRHPEAPETGKWLEKLQRWDPQNALFPLITAESISPSRFHWSASQTHPEQDRAWQSAMAAAFNSPRFDDYLDRVAELNRKVVPRYGLYDPYEVVSREEIDLFPFAFEESERYAKALVQSGADLDARGNHSGARDAYWTVARFGQLIDSQGRTPFEHWVGTSLQTMAYKKLQASFEKAGQSSEGALLGYLAAKFEAVHGEHAGLPGEAAFGQTISTRNAAVVEISGLMILFFFGLVVVAVSILIVGSRANARPAVRRARPFATMIVASSSAGLLFSSVTLYLTYRPYWYIFQAAVSSGGRSQARDLRDFLIAAETPAGVPYRVLLDALLYSGSPSFLFYVWAGVTLLGVIGLAVILLRHLREDRPAKTLQRHSRAQ